MTVGDKSLGLSSTTIDKALGGKLKDEEDAAQVTSRVCREANIDLTLVQVTRKRFHKESRFRECHCGECLRSAGIVRENSG